MKKRLDDLLRATVEYCFDAGLLKRGPIPEYVIEVPNNAAHGHFATNLAMTFASTQRRRPLDIASTIVDNLKDEQGILESTKIAGPGFINFKIRAREWRKLLVQILRERADYGRSLAGQGEKVIVEFVSANPTGPLHLGHGRGAAIGDTLCRILSFCGYGVEREFYINDAGEQIRLLGESIYSRFRQIRDPDYPFPEKGYHGDYILDLAAAVSRDLDLETLDREEAITLCAEKGKAIMLSEIREDLTRFRVDFDSWYSEMDLHNSGLLEDTLKAVRRASYLFEEDGALWIRTSEMGDDKDRVIRKSDGRFTYFASDIAYHLQKHERGFTRAIDIWGADHHGYIPRIKASLTAHGIPEDWLSVMLIQLVKLWEGGEEIRMSKRAGTFVTLRELMDDVGVDAVRFVFLTKNHESPLDFDMDLVRKQDSENPVYYVQYAHARICSIFRKAEAEGMVLPAEPGDLLGGLVLEEELDLIRTMSLFPSLLRDISLTLEPHRLTYYLTDLAALFHRYFNLGTKTPEHRIITSDSNLTQARLWLVDGVRIVVANGLRLLGIGAPEKM
ncbi:MAG: arginine--tRNA ligase [Deltaproteobacteria bacterium]|nr:arginine--tRNA ligase [Deltaproteobacteria bacterium]MBW2110394.1 arginine--tRNA ligase [Deltaproteobacteria bacterium]